MRRTGVARAGRANQGRGVDLSIDGGLPEKKQAKLAHKERIQGMMRIGIVTLGCDKNTVDNEYLAGILEQAGCELVVAGGHDEQLDAAVVTTCGFIDAAREQSVDAIVQLAERKRETGNPRRLFVAGCLAQRYADELMKEIPEIDGLVGVGQFKQLAELILKADAAERADLHAAEPTVDIYQHLHRKRLDSRPYAFLKISDGCNHGCTFCSIPLMKGRHRSVPPEILLQEARELLDQGVREINLVAQDLSSYGLDRWKDYRLPQLLRDLNALEGDFWIRCLYHYPNNLNDDLLSLMDGGSKVVPYIDMPLQHLDPNVLKLMRRPFHTVNTFELVERLRAAVPGLTLRTTMIVGFPGETPEAHRNMLGGIERMRFDRLGVFQYSKEESTVAAGMAKQVGTATKQKRWHAVMALQAEIADELSQARVGRRERVLLEEFDPHRRQWAGRSAAEAPEIDGKVFIEAADGQALKAGDFVEVEIVRSETYDVVGRMG